MQAAAPDDENVRLDNPAIVIPAFDEEQLVAGILPRGLEMLPRTERVARVRNVEVVVVSDGSPAGTAEDVPGTAPPPASPVFSVIVPCYNERRAVAETIASLVTHLKDAPGHEIIVVDDGSDDGSTEILEQLARQYPHVQVETHYGNRGYGASLKTGIRRASADLIVITDADGTYPNERIPELLELADTADMVVGARTAHNAHYPLLRKVPKLFLSQYASWMAGQRIPDLNSGLRVMRRGVVERFLNILPNSFSFTTTITLAMLTNSYVVRYVPVGYSPRVGRSKIRPIRDTLRFFQLILRTGMYFAPLRVFLPVGLLLGASFLASLAYDVFFLRDLTEKTLLLMLFGMNTAMFALLADMIDKRSAK